MMEKQPKVGDGDARDEIARRLEQLERENERLRERLEPLVGPDNPWFDPVEFRRVLRRLHLIGMVPLWVGGAALMLVMAVVRPVLPITHLGPIPIFDLGGSASGLPGIGLGVIAMGGFAVGAVAFGGGAIGLVAFGGGAAGVLAVGGGACGVIAFGGGAVGYIAIGGGAIGWYALGDTARGRYALGINRQDPEAVEFFVRYVPWLRRAVTTAVPVIPIGERVMEKERG